MTILEQRDTKQQDTMESRLEPFLDTNFQFRSVKDGGVSEVQRLVASKDKGRWFPLRFSKKIIARRQGDLSRLVEYEHRFLSALNDLNPRPKVVQSLGYSEVFDTDEQGNDIVAYQLLTKSAGVDIHRWNLLPFKLQQNQHYYYNLICHPGALLRFVKGCLHALESVHQHGVVHCDIKEDQICLPFKIEKQGDNYHLYPQFEDITLIDFGTSIWEDVPISSKYNPLPFNVNYASPYQAKSLIAAVEKQHAYRKKHAKQHYNFAQVLQDIDYGIDLYSLGYILKNMLDNMIIRHLRTEDMSAWGVFLEDYKKWINELLNQSYGIMPPYSRQNLPYKDYLAKIDAWIEQVDTILGCSSKNLCCIVNPKDKVSGVYRLAVSVSVLEEEPLPTEEEPTKAWTGQKKLLVLLAGVIPVLVALTFWLKPSKVDESTPMKAEEAAKAEDRIAERSGYILDLWVGTALDSQTKLTWNRCLLGQKWNESVEYCVGDAKKYTFDEAKIAIDELNRETSLACEAGPYVSNFCYQFNQQNLAWRMATIVELSSLDQCAKPDKVDITIGDKKHTVTRVCESGYQTVNEEIFAGWRQRVLSSTPVSQVDIKSLFKQDNKQSHWGKDFEQGKLGRVSSGNEASTVVALVLDSKTE